MTYLTGSHDREGNYRRPIPAVCRSDTHHFPLHHTALGKARSPSPKACVCLKNLELAPVTLTTQAFTCFNGQIKTLNEEWRSNNLSKVKQLVSDWHRRQTWPLWIRTEVIKLSLWGSESEYFKFCKPYGLCPNYLTVSQPQTTCKQRSLTVRP